MIILQDTREQTPLEFFFTPISDVREEKLNIGDYGCEFEDGTKSKYYFERKGIADLYGTLGQGYKRFKKEIERARQTDSILILIIEGTFSEVNQGYEYSQIEGKSILKTIFTLLIRHGVYPVFCEDRREMSEFITHFYWAEERNLIAKKVLDKKGISGKVKG